MDILEKGFKALEHIRDCIRYCCYDGKSLGAYEKDVETLESNLKFAYDVKRLLAKYGIESIDGLEEILKEYDNIGG